MSAEVVERLYSSAEVARLAGVTFRQVDIWARAGLLRTAWPISGIGDPRRFAPGEVNVARVVAALRDIGIPPGEALAMAATQAVREGATGGHVGRWYFALDDTRVTLWTAYRNGAG